MFEIDIRTEVRRGIMLHRPDGTPYWKLTIVCSNDGCENVVDMGECICFDKMGAMAACRDGHGMTCSTKCWYETATDEMKEKVRKEIKDHNQHLEAIGDIEFILDAEDEIELFDDYFDAMADHYDGSDFWEAWDIEECPI